MEKVYTCVNFPGVDFLSVHLFKILGVVLLISAVLVEIWFGFDTILAVIYGAVFIFLLLVSRVSKKFAYKIIVHDNDRIEAFMNSGEVISGSLSDVNDYKRMLYVFFRIGERKVVLKDIYDQELLDTLEAQN